MRKMAEWSLPAVLMALVLGLASACGADEDGGVGQATATPEGPLTLEQYFAEAEQVWLDLTDVFNNVATAGPESPYTVMADALDALEPPADVAAEHEAHVAALRGLVAGMTSAAQGTVVDLNAANERAIDACLAVQAVADVRGIVAFLHCDPHTGGQVSDFNPAPGETVEIVAEVLDGGEPRPGVDCAFAIVSQPGDDASLSPETVKTDENGEATVALDVGGTPGTIEVDVDCAGLTQTFTVEAGGG
jgi:hypothetical protein